ncbi:MAG: hypothetical protein WB780_16970 [Candidatus Acidiferrales bacterium]
MAVRCTRGTIVLIGILLVLSGIPAGQAQEQKPNLPKHVEVAAISARAEDVSSLDGIIKAYYEVVSGPAGEPRQWSRDRTLYIPGVRFVSMNVDKKGEPVAHVMDHQQFVDSSDAYVTSKGFFEWEIHRETKRFGNIAHIFSTYESRITKDGPVIARGVNSIELFWDGKRWWIASAIWDEEREDNPLPKDLLN